MILTVAFNVGVALIITSLDRLYGVTCVQVRLPRRYICTDVSDLFILHQSYVYLVFYPDDSRENKSLVRCSYVNTDVHTQTS